MASQLEGTNTGFANDLTLWLKNNNLDELITILNEQGIDKIDDLLMFNAELLQTSLVTNGVKLGTVIKLTNALNKYRQTASRDISSSSASSSIILLDKQEKAAIKLLSSKLFEIETKIKLLPQHTKRISLLKEVAKKEINNICQEWIKLINKHKIKMYQWIDDIEKNEIKKFKVMDEKLNNELKLAQETKSRCQGLMSYGSVNDIWNTQKSQQNEQQNEGIESLIAQCISKLDKSLNVPKSTIFDVLKFEAYNSKPAQDILNQHIGNLSVNVRPKLSVKVVDNKKIEFMVKDELNLAKKEIFIKAADLPIKNKLDDDEKKCDEAVKFPINNNHLSISVDELDEKIAISKEYIAHLICNTAGMVLKQNKTEFLIKRKEWEDSVVHKYDSTKLIDDRWKLVYDKPYKHSTKSAELKSLCANADGQEIFVGAMSTSDNKTIVLGAFGVSSVLNKFTHSKTEAIIPQQLKNSQSSVYWYHVADNSFGFAANSEISLSQADTKSSDDRLSWHLQGSSGYRAGIDTSHYGKYKKVIYIKQI